MIQFLEKIEKKNVKYVMLTLEASVRSSVIYIICGTLTLLFFPVFLSLYSPADARHFTQKIRSKVSRSIITENLNNIR